MTRKTGSNERRDLQRLADSAIRVSDRKKQRRDERNLPFIEDIAFQDTPPKQFGRPQSVMPDSRVDVQIVAESVAPDSPEKLEVITRLNDLITTRGGTTPPVEKVPYTTTVLNADCPLFFVEDETYEAKLVNSPTNSPYFWHNN